MRSYEIVHNSREQKEKLLIVRVRIAYHTMPTFITATTIHTHTHTTHYCKVNVLKTWFFSNKTLSFASLKRERWCVLCGTGSHECARVLCIHAFCFVHSIYSMCECIAYLYYLQLHCLLVSFGHETKCVFIIWNTANAIRIISFFL